MCSGTSNHGNEIDTDLKLKSSFQSKQSLLIKNVIIC